MAALRRRLRAALGDLRRSERGIALPMALMVTVVGMGLAAVPIVASVNSQGGDQHNQGSNEALAAAETGAEIALLAQGELHIAEGSNQLCVAAAGATPGWCPEEPRPQNATSVVPGSVGLATYTYRVLPCYGAGATFGGCAAVASSVGCTEAPVQIVATGTAQVAGVDVSRRVSLSGCAGANNLPADWEAHSEELESEVETLEEELRQLEGPRVPLEARRTELETKRTKLEETIAKEKAEGKTRFETKTRTEVTYVEREVAPAVFSGGQIAGVESLSISNGAQVYNGGAGSNGKVTLVGSGNVCGTVRYGTEYSATNGSERPPSNCAAGRSFVKALFNYPQVQLPNEITTKNSDARLTSADPVKESWMRSNVQWNESKHELSVSNGTTLTLEGTLPYYVCKLTLSGGSKLLMGAGKTIRFFFAEPSAEKCPGLNGSPQLVISNGTSVGPDSNHGPGFYFVGSATKEASKIELGGGSEATQFVIYAPRSKIVAGNGVTMSGTIIGQTLEIAGGAAINKAGTFTPPSSTEFVAPEEIKEEVKKSVPEEVESTLGTHEDELRAVESEIQKLTEEIEGTNQAAIEEKEEEISAKEAELVAWQELADPTSGSSSNTSFKKLTFAECTATPPSGSISPAAGC